MSSLKIRVMVTAAGGGVGLSVLRALKNSSLDLYIVGIDINPWAIGLYSCDKGYLVPPAGDVNYREKIIDICLKESIDILIPGSDPELPHLAELSHQLIAEGVLPLVGSMESVQICRDKQKAYQYFIEKKMPFVKTMLLNDSDNYLEILEMEMPLIIKPAGGSSSKDVHVVFDRKELEQFRGINNFIVQEYLIAQQWKINKFDLSLSSVMLNGSLVQKDEISIQILLDRKGIPFASFCSSNSLKEGVPSTVDPIKGTEAEAIAWKMAETLGEVGLIGPCNFQCKVTDKGPVFFEINPRFTGITAVRALFGFNEVEALIRLFHLHEKLDILRQMLQYDDSLLCSRYVTEYVMNRDKFNLIVKEAVIDNQYD